MVHGSGGKLAPGPQVHKRGDLSAGIHAHPDLPVLHDDPVVFLGDPDRFRFRLALGRQQGDRTAGRDRDQRINTVRTGLDRDRFAFQGPGTAPEALRQSDQTASREGYGIKDSHCLAGPAFRTEQVLHGRIPDRFRFGLDPAVVPGSLLIHPGNGRTGQDIMELVQEQFLPRRFHASGRVCILFRTTQLRHGAPHFRIPECKLAPAVAFLDCGLGSVYTPVRTEVQFSGIGMLRATGCFHFPEEDTRVFHAHSRHAFQVLFTRKVLQVIPGRTTAAVAVPERQKECIQVPALGALSPGLTDFLRVRAVRIAGGQEGINTGTIGALPGEVMVREFLGIVIGPEDLLGHQILDPGLLQDLRQCSRVAE